MFSYYTAKIPTHPPSQTGRIHQDLYHKEQYRDALGTAALASLNTLGRANKQEKHVLSDGIIITVSQNIFDIKMM